MNDKYSKLLRSPSNCDQIATDFTPLISEMNTSININASQANNDSMSSNVITQNVHEVQKDLKSAEKRNREEIVVLMVSETGQDRDVCYFYLESVNWNLKEAIELFKSVS